MAQNKIEIILEDGMIQDITGIPRNTIIIVRDYDVLDFLGSEEEKEEYDIEQDKDGVDHYVTYWGSRVEKNG